MRLLLLKSEPSGGGLVRSATLGSCSTLPFCLTFAHLQTATTFFCAVHCSAALHRKACTSDSSFCPDAACAKVYLELLKFSNTFYSHCGKHGTAFFHPDKASPRCHVSGLSPSTLSAPLTPLPFLTLGAPSTYPYHRAGDLGPVGPRVDGEQSKDRHGL